MKLVSKNESGFTLVELMVVVAIIGILTAVAVPNFKKYQSKSKQSEAKIQLAAVYQAEVGSNSDFNTYATCLFDLGYEPNPRGYYRVGWTAANGATAVIVAAAGGQCGTAAGGAANSGAGANATPALDAAGGAIPGGAFLNSTGVAVTAAMLTVVNGAVVPTQTTFTAAAVGNIGPGNGGVDRWTINQLKAIRNTGVGY